MTPIEDDVTDSTPTAGLHATLHNELAAAVNDILDTLGGDGDLRLRGLVRDMTSGDALPSKQFVVEWDSGLGEISDFDLEEIT